METLQQTKRKSDIEVKVLAVNTLNQYAKKYSEYEAEYFKQFTGKDILKVDGSLKAKYEHEKLSDKLQLEDGTWVNAHYWFHYSYHSFDMRIKICVSGGSYDDHPSTAFCQYEETTYTLFDTDNEGKVKVTERFNNDYTPQYEAATLLKEAQAVNTLAEAYETAERSIPHYFRGVLNIKILAHN